MTAAESAGRQHEAPRRGLRSSRAPTLRKALLPALAVFACACAFVVQSPGWAQTSYMALSKALWHGTAQIDEWHWESHDIAWSDGHYYSVKPPGLVLVTFPLYAGLRAAGAQELSTRGSGPRAQGRHRGRGARLRSPTTATAGSGRSLPGRRSPTTRR